MNQTIKPTTGRVVLFHPTPDVTHAAIIAHVHTDTMVNLAAFDSNGVAYNKTSVALVQSGQQAPGSSSWCEWMPYQVGQAKNQEDSATLTLSPDILAALKRTIVRVDQVIALALEMAGQE